MPTYHPAEIDLLLEIDGAPHPVEIKLSATVKRSWIDRFDRLDRLGVPRAHGAVLCLAPEPLPLSERDQALPMAAL